MSSPTQWHKLDRDRTAAMIDSVKTSDDYIMFSIATSEAKCAKLSFYRNFLLYRLTNFSSLPSFSFDYIGDGRTYYYLDGGTNAIYAANDTGNLALTNKTVVDYIAFFFEHVTGPDGDVALIDNPRDNPSLDALTETQLQDIAARNQPPEVSADGKGGFKVNATLFYVGMLVRADIHVDAAGRVNVDNYQMLMSVAPDYSSEGATA